MSNVTELFKRKPDGPEGPCDFCGIRNAPRYHAVALFTLCESCSNDFDAKQSATPESQARDALITKDVTWQVQFDGFIEPCFVGDPASDRYLTATWEVSNAQWDVRLSIAPGVGRKDALRVAKGLIEWLEGMSDDEYAMYQKSEEEGRYPGPRGSTLPEVPF